MYTFTVTADELAPGERVFVVRCAELPAFIAQGATVDMALQDAVDLLRDGVALWPDVPLTYETIAADCPVVWKVWR